MTADYVIGCDGGRSTVRKLADIEFEGFTYPERFIKIATTFDFATVNPNLCFRNYFSDPDEWCNLFKVRGESPEGLWRAIFPVAPTRTSRPRPRRSASRRGCRNSFPKPGRYQVEYVNIYGVHQRVAATFRKGRVLLAGDSAHVNNPIGGMGMNGGMHDGINLAEKLAQVIHGEADEALARPLRPPAPPRRGEVRAGADHRQQAADGGARPRGAPGQFRRAPQDRREPRFRPGLHAPGGAVRQPARRGGGDLSACSRRGHLRGFADEGHILPMRPSPHNSPRAQWP